MGVYVDARNLLNEMLYDIVCNETLMKYIVYDNVDVDPLSLPAIVNPKQYIFNPLNPKSDAYRIFPIPKIPATDELAKTIIVGRILQTKPIGNNPFHKNYVIAFDVISHVYLWAIPGGKLRPLEIMDLLNELYNQKYSPNSMKPLFPESDPYITYTKDFCGYRLVYNATSINSQNTLTGNMDNG
jgi:hypothetical protein